MRTRVFDLAEAEGYSTLTRLAIAMGVSLATVSRVRAEKVGAGTDFIAGALRAFPGRKFEDLFIFETGDAVDDLLALVAV